MKNELNKKIRGNNAITLIALVITIIVLLILAGITVAQLSGNNLFENAKLAKEKYKHAREIGDETLEDYEDAITGDRGNKYNYSTEEVVVGTWINGKPIYQKTLSFNWNTSTDLYNKQYDYARKWEHGISNIDIIVGKEGIYYNTVSNSYGTFAQSSNEIYNLGIQFNKQVVTLDARFDCKK